MHPNEELLTRFYQAFARRDPDAMARCYAADATFSDPVFPDLRGADVMRMWRMLGASTTELVLTFEGVVADDNSGTARWEARYPFSRTGRKVHNVVEAHFELRNGLIVRHVDSFSFWCWSRQALGPVGWLLGWTPYLRNKVRREAAGRLAAFKAAPRAAKPANGSATKGRTAKAAAKPATTKR